jgi:transposase
MRFVAVKTVEQQSVMVLHRTRLLLMRQRTRLANAIRGHMAEYGIVAPSGREGLQRLSEMIVNASDERVPPLAKAMSGCLQSHRRPDLMDRRPPSTIFEWEVDLEHRAAGSSRRLP